MSKRIEKIKNEMLGKSFGRLKVIAFSHQNKNKHFCWLCLCDCQQEKITTTGELKSGSVKSCGCLRKENSKKLLTEINKNHAGSNHYNWKNGLTNKNTSIRNSTEYLTWRDLVFKKDNYTCQKCHKFGVKLHAHHIFDFSNYPEKRFDIDNGTVLCVDCHRSYHKIFGKLEPNDIWQYYAFLGN